LKNITATNHSFLAEELLVPNANKTDGNRLTMWCSHATQGVTHKYAEPPLMYTNFEDQVGEHSRIGYKEVDDDYLIVKKIFRNDFNYVVVLQSRTTGKFHVMTRTECQWLTEHYGYKWNNALIDELEEGDEFEKGDIAYANDCYDEQMNFGFGVNLNAAYFTYKNLTLEDAIVISESAAKKLTSYTVSEVEINVNSNDILLNLYGNEQDYKSFPDIGEHITKHVLSGRRRVNYSSILYELKNLKKTREDDTIFFSEGQVVDIKIYSNIPREELEKQPYNTQVKKYIEMNDAFNKEVYKVLKPIVEGKNNNEYTEELLSLYNYCKMQLDKNAKYTFQNSEFNGFVIKFTILDEQKLNVGSKITGRYGNKGCISAIVPDDEMPIVESGPFKGLRAEICLNPLGVYNRLNPSQLIEQEINFIGKYVRKRIEKAKTLEGKRDHYLTFINKVESEEDAGYILEFVNTLTEEEELEFYAELVEKGIPVCQKPFFGNIELEQLQDLYASYPEADFFKCENIATPMIIGETYMIRLKHEPIFKFSARGTSFDNLSSLPAKSKAYKENKELFSKTPIRLGNMEISNLGLTNHMDSVINLLNTYSNDMTNREELITELLTGSPFDTKVELSVNQSNTSKILEALFYCLGLELEKSDEAVFDEIESKTK